MQDRQLVGVAIQSERGWLTDWPSTCATTGSIHRVFVCTGLSSWSDLSRHHHEFSCMQTCTVLCHLYIGTLHFIRLSSFRHTLRTFLTSITVAGINNDNAASHFSSLIPCLTGKHSFLYLQNLAITHVMYSYLNNIEIWLLLLRSIMIHFTMPFWVSETCTHITPLIYVD